MSREHFSVDGTLIESWASLKSLWPKDDDGDGDSNGWGDFRGQKRSNQTHQSKTDPAARLMRKGKGREAKLSFGGHALVENRHGLLVDLRVSEATGRSERQTAVEMLGQRQRRRRITVAADRGYDDGLCRPPDRLVVGSAGRTPTVPKRFAGTGSGTEAGRFISALLGQRFRICRACWERRLPGRDARCCSHGSSARSGAPARRRAWRDTRCSWSRRFRARRTASWPSRGSGSSPSDRLGAGPGELVLVAHGSRCRDLTIGRRYRNSA